jgi:hypothetical protein
MKRLLSKNDCSRPPNTHIEDGLSTISKLYFTIDKASKNQNDIGFLEEKENTFVVNVYRFTTLNNYKKDNYSLYDIREPVNKFMKHSYNNHLTTELTNLDWKSFEMPKTSPLTVSALNQIPNIRPSQLRSNSATSLHNPSRIKNNNTQQVNNRTNQMNARATHIIEQRIHAEARTRQIKFIKPKSNLIFK